MKTILMTLLAVSAAPALANTRPPERPQGVVRYDDLNLHTHAGAAALRRRIDRMVVDLSGGDEAPMSLTDRVELAKARAKGRSQADCLIGASGAPS